MDVSLFSIAIHGFLFLVLLVASQDLHVFPGAVFSLIRRPLNLWPRVPKGVESVFISASDGKQLEVWRVEKIGEDQRLPFVAIIFHGNGGTLHNFLFPQLWFQELGITSYGFDYRGYGRSSGWPSEQGIYRDSDALWEYVIEREQLAADRIIVCGISLGGAPAARVAALHQPRLLILASAFAELSRVLRDQPLVGLLAPFLWSKFPTVRFISELRTTDLVLLHGAKDKTVLPHHAMELESAYAGTGRAVRLVAPDAGHNSSWYAVRRELEKTLRDSGVLPDTVRFA